MDAIYGWLGTEVLEPGHASSIVRTALARAGEDATHRERIDVARTAAMGAIGPASWCAGARDGVRATLCGRAFWDLPELQELAVERGLAASAIEGYRRWGHEFLERLHGTFAVAIVDPAKEEVIAAIDRIGIGTLCYAAAAQGIVFGSRADAVALHPWARSGLDPQGIFNYLFSHVVPAPGTIFLGVRKLLPAQYARYHRGALTTGFYWRLDYRDRATQPVGELSQRFRALLPVVVERTRSGERIGTFLSGGTDSTTVTGVLANLDGSQPDAYSIGFEAEGFDEMRYARIAADRFRVRHHIHYVTAEDVLAAVPIVARAYDEPFGNASAVPTYCCARLARADGIHVMLAGDGGDEIFGGNTRYAKQTLFEAYRLVPGPLRAGFVEPLLGIPGLSRVPGVRKALSYVRQARVPLPDRLESYNFLVRERLAEILDGDFLSVISPEQPFEVMREVYERTASGSAVNRMMHLDLKQTLADNDLRKVTRMCSLAGIDVRYPLLDEEMVAFSGLVPSSQKVRGTRLRPFFKAALADLLPPEIIAKQKHGFGLPFGLWLRAHRGLRELAYDSLSDLGKRGFLRSSYIDGLLSRHATQDASYFGVMIWVLMMLEQWLQASAGSRTPGPPERKPNGAIAVAAERQD